jgi:ABC-type dipeptide/oligopeptide/nickel transport system permease subunit
MSDMTRIVSAGNQQVEKFAVYRALLRYPLPRIGFLILAFLFLISLFAPLLAPYDPNEQDLYNVLKGPSATHWLGTDELGRDLLSRFLYGGRVSFAVGFIATIPTIFIGLFLGLLAGFKGGGVDGIIMRIADAVFCFPPLVVTLALFALLGGGIQNVIIAVILFGWPGLARIVRGQVLQVRELPYVEASFAAGASQWLILFRHVLPNVMAPVIVSISLGLATSVGLEAGASYLGLGVQPPTASWGVELRSGQNYLENHPIYSLVPGLLITAAVLAFNFIGDGLRDILDPRLRGEANDD